MPEETGVVGLLTEGRDLGGPIIRLPEGVGGADFATAGDVVLLGPALCKRSLMRPSFWWPFPPLPLLAFPGEDEGVVVLEGDVSGVGVGVEGAAGAAVAGLLVELIFFFQERQGHKEFRFCQHVSRTVGAKIAFSSQKRC